MVCLTTNLTGHVVYIDILFTRRRRFVPYDIRISPSPGPTALVVSHTVGSTWGMQYHPQKYNSISVARSHTPHAFNYTLKGHALESVNTAKYLGITLSSNMSWDTHINNITAKANKILSFLHRNLQIKQEETKSLAYKSMVRSNLEYCSSIWALMDCRTM